MILLARNLSLDSWILISHVISQNAAFLINNLKHTYLLLYLESKSSYIRVKTLVTCSYYTCTFSWYMIVKWPGHSALLSTVVRLKHTDGLKLTSDRVHVPLTLGGTGCTFLFHCLHITALWRTALDCASPLCETSLGCGIRTEDKAGPGQDYRKLPSTLKAPAGASSRTGLFWRLVSTVHSTGVFSLDKAKSDKD